MSEWKKVKLGDYIDVLSGFAFKSKDFSDSGIPVIKIKNVCPPYISLEDLSYVPNSIAFQNPRYILRKGDVLIAMTGSHINQIASVVGRVGRVRYDAITVLNQRVGKIVNKNEAKSSLDYIYYYLSQYEVKVELAQKAGGAANQANISPSDIKNLLFPYPPIGIQHRIATILSRYDSLIENYQKQIKLLEEAAQRLYKEWFIDLHFPEHENTNIIDGVPEGWEKKKVNSIIELQSGFAFKSSTFDDNGAYKIVTIKNVKDGAFDGDNVSRIVAIPEKMPKHCVLADGDILLSLTGNVGRVCIVNGKNYLLNQRVAKLATDYKAFAYCLFRSRDMFIEVNNLANGAAQQNVSPIRIGGIKMLLPNMDMLQKFESTASKLITRIIYLQSQLRLLTEARDRLLPKLMSGEIEI